MNSLLLILFLGISLVLAKVPFDNVALDEILDDNGDKIMDELSDRKEDPIAPKKPSPTSYIEKLCAARAKKCQKDSLKAKLRCTACFIQCLIKKGQSDVCRPIPTRGP